jgi:cytochrome c553
MEYFNNLSRSGEMIRNVLVLLSAVVLTSLGAPSLAADAAAGKAKADAVCADCHEAADWEGEDAHAIEGLIRDVAAGKTKHKIKVDLTDAEISDIAAYWATAGG